MKLNPKLLLDVMYPVGSYYETSNASFNPNTAWGGTWVEDTKGRVTVALDTNDTDFNNTGKTGGSKTHTIGMINLPGQVVGASTQNTEWNCGRWGANSGYTFTTINDQNNTDTHGTNSNPISNLQPYVVVKRWHRTA